MKKFKSILGVTLLEIMLVLAIAAMIIVMSVRYYQAASSSQQATAALSMIQGITAAGDGLAQGSDGYNAVTQASVQNIMNGGKPLLAPWGAAVTIFAQSPTSYDVRIETVSSAICTNLATQLSASPRYQGVTPAAGSCPTSGTIPMTYRYDSTK